MTSLRTCLIICLILASGCQSPMLIFPGKALAGPVAETESFGFAEAFRLLTLEVNPAEPYSVLLRTTVIDGELYIDAAPARRWGHQIANDNRVRVKLGDTVYHARAIPVSDPAILSSFLGGRVVYRLEPASVNPQ